MLIFPKLSIVNLMFHMIIARLGALVLISNILSHLVAVGADANSNVSPGRGLQHNSLTGEIPQWLVDLPMLQEL